MAKKESTKKKASVEVTPAPTYVPPNPTRLAPNNTGLEIQVKLDSDGNGKIKVIVTLLKDGNAISSDYDWVKI